MAWQSVGDQLVAAVTSAWAAQGVGVGWAGVTVGEQPLDCAATPVVAAWVTGVDPDPSPIRCAVTPRVNWTVRVADCGDDPASWLTLLSAAWCALADWVCAGDDPEVSFVGARTDSGGGMVWADLEFVAVETC